MNHDEIISQLVEKNQKILYIGVPSDIVQETISPTYFHSVNPDEAATIDLETLDKDFDTVIYAEVLELSSNPRQIIEKFKWHAKNAIVYEFKYDQMETINPDWKLSWKHVGLENTLIWEFDYVRSLYLGYATVYFCEGPNKYSPEELAKGFPIENV